MAFCSDPLAQLELGSEAECGELAQTVTDTDCPTAIDDDNIPTEDAAPKDEAKDEASDGIDAAPKDEAKDKASDVITSDELGLRPFVAMLRCLTAEQCQRFSKLLGDLKAKGLNTYGSDCSCAHLSC